MKTKKLNKYLILGIETLVIVGLTFSTWLIPLIPNRIGGLITRVIINLLFGVSAFISIKLSGLKIDFEWKNYKQYVIGLIVCLILSICIAWIPALCGFSLVGGHQDFALRNFVFNFLFYLGVIGPVEELVFRVYYQKTFVSLFPKHKWIGVIIASLLFGFWHIINGSIAQVIFTFGIGLVFGFAKQYIKDLHYPGIALTHGLYDFLNYIVTLVIV